jgi:hypothetical protein
MKNNSNNSMNINLNRATVIDRLKAKRVTLVQDYGQARYLEDAYREQMKEYAAAVAEFVHAEIARIGTEAVMDISSYSDSTTIRVNFSARHIPEPKNPRYNGGYMSPDRIDAQVKELDRMIDLLEMCTDETIKSKQYGNMLEFLS